MQLYLRFTYFEDNCLTFGILGEQQSCSQFPPLPTPHQFASCSCQSPAPSSPQDGRSSRAEEQHYKHSTASAPLFHAARGTGQTTAARTTSFRKTLSQLIPAVSGRNLLPTGTFGELSCQNKEPLSRRLSTNSQISQMHMVPFLPGNIAKCSTPDIGKTAKFDIAVSKGTFDKNASGRGFFYAYVCPKKGVSSQMFFLANGQLSWDSFICQHRADTLMEFCCELLKTR